MDTIKIEMKSKDEMKVILNEMLEEEKPKLKRLSGKFLDLVTQTETIYNNLVRDLGDKTITVTRDINPKIYRYYTTQNTYIPVDKKLVKGEIC